MQAAQECEQHHCILRGSVCHPAYDKKQDGKFQFSKGSAGPTYQHHLLIITHAAQAGLDGSLVKYAAAWAPCHHRHPEELAKVRQASQTYWESRRELKNTS